MRKKNRGESIAKRQSMFVVRASEKIEQNTEKPLGELKSEEPLGQLRSLQPSSNPILQAGSNEQEEIKEEKKEQENSRLGEEIPSAVEEVLQESAVTKEFDSPIK